MDAQELTLHIAANLGRVCRWALEKREDRVAQFLQETEEYLQELEKAPKNEQFQETFETFKNNFEKLKGNVQLDKYWAEDILTWANILTHRAKLA
ncbi:MAG: hypothetical protein HYS83_01105 [Candidatus Blackburnbacteria bacterium]|nr:hypothetical protein [Candidatus Blackburnbacteria bacterium]